MINIRHATAFVASMAMSVLAEAGGSQLILSGRIDSVDLSTETIAIQGKHLRTTDARRVSPGQYVNIYGVLKEGGSISDVIIESASSYAVGSASDQGAQRAAALTGTGMAAEALTGTGAHAEALTGTGEKTEALTGTGNRAEALTGTGEKALALTGTGNHAEALTGTGVAAN